MSEASQKEKQKNRFKQVIVDGISLSPNNKHPKIYLTIIFIYLSIYTILEVY